MNKTIIGIYGRGKEGKSTTIKKVVELILTNYPNAVASVNPVDYSADILLTIHIGTVKIGFESQGDPNSRMIYADTVENLAKIDNCDIIVCATRTEGETVKKVDYVADIYGYDTVWLSSFWSPKLKQRVLNYFAAENIIKIIDAIIIGRL
ncbi:MAG: hypothetical protein ABI402_15955 [Ferruginibacter sp.]